MYKTMKSYPNFPKDWKDPEQTMYRDFHFTSTPDIETLQRLVKEHIPDRGNDGVLRARLLGILDSYWSRANARFWEQHEHPRTYRVRLFWRNVRGKFHRAFNTRKFKRDVAMSRLATRLIDELFANEKK